MVVGAQEYLFRFWVESGHQDCCSVWLQAERLERLGYLQQAWALESQVHQAKSIQVHQVKSSSSPLLCSLVHQ